MAAVFILYRFSYIYYISFVSYCIVTSKMKNNIFFNKKEKNVDGANRTPNLTNSIYFSRTLSPIELHRLEPLFNSFLMSKRNSMTRKSNIFVLKKLQINLHVELGLPPSSSLSEKKKFFFMLLSGDIALFCYFDRRSRKPRLKII